MRVNLGFFKTTAVLRLSTIYRTATNVNNGEQYIGIGLNVGKRSKMNARSHIFELVYIVAHKCYSIVIVY